MTDKTNWWRKLWQPNKNKWLLFLPTGAFIAILFGITSVHAYYFVFDFSNRNELCYSCHIGMDTIVEEYEESVHFQNNLGIQAQCSDCHVPKEFFPKLKTKILALGDVYHMAVGTYTLENWEENRVHLSQIAYEKIKEVDSSTCKSCHNPEHWGTSMQPARARLNHNPARWKERGETCVDCHKGVAHQRPVIK